MPAGTLRYWASARAAAGVDEDQLDVETLDAAVAAALERHADRPRLGPTLGICAFVVDGSPVGTRDHHAVRLADGWVVEALPPFAGG